MEYIQVDKNCCPICGQSGSLFDETTETVSNYGIMTNITVKIFSCYTGTKEKPHEQSIFGIEYRGTLNKVLR